MRFVLASQRVTASGHAHFAHKSTTELGALRVTVREVLGVPVAGFTGSYNPGAVHLDGGSFRAVEEKPLDASYLRSGTPLPVGGLAPGDLGLRQLVARGDLRPATATDQAKWKGVVTRPLPFFLEGTYIVRRQTMLPRGMEGVNGRYFLIPKGVTLPHNVGVHNAFYQFENGNCSGFC